MESNEDKIFEPKMLGFIAWRNSHLQNTAKKCKIIESTEVNDEDLNNEVIVNLPKCLVHFTRKMCKCNHDCIGKTFSTSDIDTECSSFDTKNLWYDDKYKNCNFLEWTVNNGSLSIIKKNGKDKILSNEIMIGLQDLCHSKENFLDLLCKSYDLRDNCLNDQDCIIAFLERRPIRLCENNEYSEQREILERILNFNFENSTDQENFKKINGFENMNQSSTKSVYKRDLTDYKDLNLQMMEQNISNYNINNYTEYSDHIKTYKSYSLISISMISGVLLLIFAISAIKNTKKSFSIPACCLTSIMFLMSIYLNLFID